MEKIDLESKYQKLAAEYSKVRSHATVLKKAVLDEQAKNLEMKELLKNHERQIRKHDQEMESLTFRNEQLTKRITVLQQELQVNSQPKKGKSKINENVNIPASHSVLDEELQKKIIENAHLVSSMADKDFEISDCREKIEWLEKKATNLEKEIHDKDVKYNEEIAKLKREHINEIKTSSVLDDSKESESCNSSSIEQARYWEEQVERWKSECEFLKSKPESNKQLIEYYENQLSELLEAKQLAQSECKALWAENSALYARLENLTLEKKELENDLKKSNEELVTTTENYKSQLDAMTEHLAAQNEKITEQCDEIQILKHKSSKK